MKRTNFHIAPDHIKRLRVLAGGRGVSVAELVRRAIERYLEAEERKQTRGAKP